MVELKVYLSEDLNEKFRRIAMAVHGYGRGSLSKAAEEAFTRWCAEHDGLAQKTSPAAISDASNATSTSGINPDERPQDRKRQDTIDEKGTSRDSSETSAAAGSPLST